jgi:hypothetical protein
MQNNSDEIKKNIQAFIHETERANDIKYGYRIIKQIIHDSKIVGVEELEHKINWKDH